MTDIPDGSGQIPRRSSRVGDGGAPVSGALAIVLAVVAVVAGFLILRSISDGGNDTADFPDAVASDGQGVTPGDGDDPESTDPEGSGVATLPTTTTTPPLVKTGASVIVANANSQGGSAGNMTRALREVAGFELVDPTNSSEDTGDLEASVVYFDATVPASQDVANSVARVLGGVSVLPLGDTAPTRDGTLGGADVLVMLGNDVANRPLDEIAPGVLGGGASTVSNPPVSGTGTTPPGTDA